MNTFCNIFIPRHRKVLFEAVITIEKLTDIPLLFGLFYAKYKINGNYNSGSTPLANISEHQATWNHKFKVNVTLIIGHDGILEPLKIHFNVKQQSLSGRKDSIGKLSVDLSEFVSSNFKTKLYLLDQSKMNCTLQIHVEMNQLEENKSIFKTYFHYCIIF
jgi:hypothetical protein